MPIWVGRAYSNTTDSPGVPGSGAQAALDLGLQTALRRIRQDQAITARDKEYIFGALPIGCDLRRHEPCLAVLQGEGHLVQQPGTILRRDLHDGLCAVVRKAEVDARRDRKVLERARHH